MRFYDVTQGAITVDGHDICNLSGRNIAGSLGWSCRMPTSMKAASRKNLRFGNLEATDEEIVQAAKAANVDHFIRTLPGYNMEMNRGIQQYFLGQKQL